MAEKKSTQVYRRGSGAIQSKSFGCTCWVFAVVASSASRVVIIVQPEIS